MYISDYAPEDALTALRLIDQWENLNYYLDPPFPYRNSVQSETEQLLQKARQNFSHLFAEELDTVRSVRNSIAHARYVPPGDLNGALAAAQELNRIFGKTNLLELAHL